MHSGGPPRTAVRAAVELAKSDGIGALAGLELWLRLRDAGRHDPDSSFAIFIRSAYVALEQKITGWLTVLADEDQLDPAAIEPAPFMIMTYLDGLAMRHVNGLDDDPDDLRRRLRWMLAQLPLRQEN
ncbi:hypothetical protein [Microlunatus speluncae]|uniref:hypothetical protein n=1 Tax=Microlunatus speluncae TaxID=2594267 RepID=UPI0012661B0F|nr:hypothetical protein [Microlunatus speluncae]